MATLWRILTRFWWLPVVLTPTAVLAYERFSSAVWWLLAAVCAVVLVFCGLVLLYRRGWRHGYRKGVGEALSVSGPHHGPRKTGRRNRTTWDS